MGKIFFSFRSADSSIADRIFDRLVHNYGRDEVHADLHPAARKTYDIRTYVDDFLGQYVVFVLVIGPTWIQTHGHVRPLDDSQDIVRVEVAAALARGVPVIPVLVRGAQMPQADELPDELKTLVQKEPLAFASDETFRGDMMRLHRRLAASLAQQEVPQAKAGPTDDTLTQARKDLLSETARIHTRAGRPPFEGVRIETLGEVLWILGARYGDLSKRFGERQFEPDLSKANLAALNLRGASLYGAKLSGANLKGADLSGAILDKAVLSDADLTQVNLSRARLNGTILTAARLELADLTDCSIEGATLSAVDLSTTTLTGANLRSARLQHARLAGQELPGAMLAGADLSDADLTDVALPRAHLEEAILQGTRLNDADLSSANLTEADLSGASLKNVDLSGVDLTGAIIGSVESMSSVIIDANTRLDHVKWRGKPVKDPRRIKNRDQRLRAYREVAQTYRDIAEMLRDAGFLAEASSYRLLEQRMRRELLFDTGRYGAWFFSALMNVISGYGERIGRTLATYIILILGFAVIYFVGANFLQMGSTTHLSMLDALVESLVSFHGRGFVSAALQLGDPMAWVTVAEAISGLFVEIIFIATFSRRFLGF